MTVGEMIAELHAGQTYAQTKAKHGKAVADRQAIAIAMEQDRKFKRGRRRKSLAGG